MHYSNSVKLFPPGFPFRFKNIISWSTICCNIQSFCVCKFNYITMRASKIFITYLRPFCNVNYIILVHKSRLKHSLIRPVWCAGNEVLCFLPCAMFAILNCSAITVSIRGKMRPEVVIYSSCTRYGYVLEI